MAVITISRMPGASGDELAHALARRLEYRYVGREELIQLAEGLGGPDVALERSPEIRERSPSFWERLNEERRRYASVLRRAVTQLAEEDNVVIVGLGAGLMLKGLGHVLAIQIVAPTDFRQAQVMENGWGDVTGPLPRDRARDVLRHADREAAGYIRYLFNVDWLDPQNWGLVLNAARFQPGQAVELIAAMVGSGTLQPTARDAQRLANMTLASRVEAALLSDANVWVSGLKVTGENGLVHLEGEVITEEDREAVETIVQAVDGVRRIENDVRVQPPPLTGM